MITSNWPLRNYLLVLTLVYTTFYVVVVVLTRMNVYFTYNQLDNIISLGIFLLPLFPIYWLSYLKAPWLRILLLSSYTLIAGAFYLVSLVAIFFIANDVFHWSNNGYRPEFETTLQDGRQLIVFLSPDKWALGGSDHAPAIVKKLIPGLEQRHFLQNLRVQFDIKEECYFAIVDDHKYILRPIR